MLTQYPSRTTLPASDLQRAKRFYSEKLGLEPEQEEPEGLYYRSGDGTPFFVFASSGTASGQHTQMGWQVPDLEAVVADLKGRGVVFEEYDTPYFKTMDGIATTDVIKAAWFKDSEGNLLGLVEYLDPRLAFAR